MPSDANFGVPSLSARYAVQIRRLADYLAAERASTRAIAAELALLADRSAPAPVPSPPKIEPVDRVEPVAPAEKMREDQHAASAAQDPRQARAKRPFESEDDPKAPHRIGKLVDTTA